MAQLGNTGINGNLMVVGKIVTNSILTNNIQANVINSGDGNFSGDVTMSPGHLKTNLIKSADDSQWIAEITNNGLEIGGAGTPLRFYSSTRPVVIDKGDVAYTSDIPTFSLSGTTLTITL